MNSRKYPSNPSSKKLAKRAAKKARKEAEAAKNREMWKRMFGVGK